MFVHILVVQTLEDESFEPLQTLIEELISNTDQNKQRGAAELLAGLLNGMGRFALSQPEGSNTCP